MRKEVVAVPNRASLATESGGTEESIFFSVVAHRMNINYLFLAGMRNLS